MNVTRRQRYYGTILFIAIMSLMTPHLNNGSTHMIFKNYLVISIAIIYQH